MSPATTEVFQGARATTVGGEARVVGKDPLHTNHAITVIFESAEATMEELGRKEELTT